MSSMSHWCYGCSRFVMIISQKGVICAACRGGFVEQIEKGRFVHTLGRNAGNYSGSTYVGRSLNMGQNVIPLIPRSGRNSGIPPYFRPLIVRRADGGERRGLELFYYNDGISGIMPLSEYMSENVLASRLGRLLERISQREANGTPESEAPPASKAAIEEIPAIIIGRNHLKDESCCAICMEKFKLGDKVRELQCKHKYHYDCILSWLSIRGSCPVCRHRLSPKNRRSNGVPNPELWRLPPENGEPNSGLIVWRLPGGGFAAERIPRRSSLQNYLAGVRREEGRSGGGDGGGSRWSRFFESMLICFGISFMSPSRSSQAARRRRRRRNRSMEVNNNGISGR